MYCMIRSALHYTSTEGFLHPSWLSVFGQLVVLAVAVAIHDRCQDAGLSDCMLKASLLTQQACSGPIDLSVCLAGVDTAIELC